MIKQSPVQLDESVSDDEKQQLISHVVSYLTDNNPSNLMFRQINRLKMFGIKNPVLVDWANSDAKLANRLLKGITESSLITFGFYKKMLLSMNFGPTLTDKIQKQLDDREKILNKKTGGK